METIVCNYDFSPSSENAARFANDLAQRINARVILFHSIYEPVGTDFIGYGGMPYTVPIRDQSVRQAVQRKLTEARNQIEVANLERRVPYFTEIRYGYTQDTLAEIAREKHADLVVMGSENLKGLQGMLTGSLELDVIKSIRCPVLIVPPMASFIPFRKIVFATDLQGEPFTDIQYVLWLADVFQAEVLFLHIFHEDDQDTKQMARHELELLHKRLLFPRASFHKKKSAHIEEGISQFCKQHRADLLVMGYHPHSFWRHLFSQNPMQEIVSHAFLPMLVIHYKH
ncbi:universal stress protein [Nibribacter koreensis]|uniref:Universal stress protein n=1 Tax=Nibribacter koreensis TaxID=1084519 RepID=A0ABP8F662_9BACT